MTNWLLLIQALLLVVVIYLLRKRDAELLRVEQEMFLKALDAVANGYKRPVPQDSGVWEVLKRSTNGWQLHGFVRENTPAWKAAFDTPGFALRHEPGAAIEEGVQ